jgi:hypothetical protein
MPGTSLSHCKKIFEENIPLAPIRRTQAAPEYIAALFSLSGQRHTFSGFYRGRGNDLSLARLHLPY